MIAKLKEYSIKYDRHDTYTLFLAGDLHGGIPVHTAIFTLKNNQRKSLRYLHKISDQFISTDKISQHMPQKYILCIKIFPCGDFEIENKKR